MSWKVISSALRISWGMLLRPSVFPLAIFLRLLSKTSFVEILDKVACWGPLASRMRPSGLCQEYFEIIQWHIEGGWWDHCIWGLVIGRRFVVSAIFFGQCLQGV